MSRIKLYFTTTFTTDSKFCRWYEYCESYLTLSKKKTPPEDFYLRNNQSVPANGHLFAARDFGSVLCSFLKWKVHAQPKNLQAKNTFFQNQLTKGLGLWGWQFLENFMILLQEMYTSALNSHILMKDKHQEEHQYSVMQLALDLMLVLPKNVPHGSFTCPNDTLRSQKSLPVKKKWLRVPATNC